MSALLPDVDPQGLREFSVVYTDRALNHMSQRFIEGYQEVLATLRTAYGADHALVVPGSGTFGMEAVARQFANDQAVLIVRNGWFSFRWSQILDAGRLGARQVVCQARPLSDDAQAPWQPCPIDEVVAAIHAERPAVVFAPQVETASGILLPDAYLQALAEAAHAVDALLVVDAIAAGPLWLDMRALGIDVLLSAPQKSWSSTPCGALLMLSERARSVVERTTSSSFACDLKQWLTIADGYVAGRATYHATMPTDSLMQLRDTMRETAAFGWDATRDAQFKLGRDVRALLARHGLPSVAAPGFEAPGVVVSYTREADIQNGQRFRALGLQVAAGVPLRCGEPADFQTVRFGLFGLDKWRDVAGTVQVLADALAQIAPRQAA